PLIHRPRLPNPQAFAQPRPQPLIRKAQQLLIDRDGGRRRLSGRGKQAAQQHLRLFHHSLLHHSLRSHGLEHLAMQQAHDRQRDQRRKGEQGQQLARPCRRGEQKHRQQ
ncbi:MAG: hypothetical protein ACK55I_03190, partial [bacterium]